MLWEQKTTRDSSECIGKAGMPAEEIDVAPAADPVYTLWVERNAYVTALTYSAFIAVLLPAFYFVLQPVHAPNDSFALRAACSGCAIVAGTLLLLVPRIRRYSEWLQLLQVGVTLLVIDMLVVNSGDQYLYIASALLVIIGVQNAFFRTGLLAATMAMGLLFLAAYSAARGMLLQPDNVVTLGIFTAAYALAFIPASMHIASRQSDIRSRLRALEATRELEEAHAITHLGKWSQDLQTGKVECSAELLRILGLPLNTPMAALPELYARSIHADDRAMVESAFAAAGACGEFSVDHRIVRDGAVRWVQLSGKQQAREDGALSYRLGTIIDITERKEAELSLERLARYDPLTGLPNRALLAEELAKTLHEQGQARRNCAVLFLDLDRFKDVNDTLGHSVGDLLLKEVASRLCALVPPGTLVARWGGDEFVAVLRDPDGRAGVERACRKLIRGLSCPFTVGTYEFSVAASVGAAVFPADGASAEVLVRNADTAMYAAKETPDVRYAFFVPHMHRLATMRHQVQNQLQSAVSTNSLELYYQPIVDARSEVVGAEALLRWHDAEGNVHAPEDFIAIAEDTGAIVPIGMWVIEQAAEQAVRWKRSGLPLDVAVNISPRQLTHPQFLEGLQAAMRRTGVDPASLELEITESGLVPNAASVMRVLESIRSMGARIAVDDFGTGYSAFSYLKQLPLSTLKIDRTFVEGIEREVDRSIAESIIAIAHRLGLSVTAEGVETVFQRKVLAELGCDRFQGFLICKPLEVSGFERFARMRLAAG